MTRPKKSPLSQETILERRNAILLNLPYSTRTPRLLDNIDAVVKAENDYGLERNISLLNTEHVMCSEIFPAGQLLGLLIALWERREVLTGLQYIAGHPNKGVQMLRRDGFRMPKRTKDGREDGRDFTVWDEADQVPKATIIGYDPPTQKTSSTWQLPAWCAKQIKKVLERDFLGRAEKTMEVDHRMPESQRIRHQIAPPVITPETLISGEWYGTFQVLSSHTNTYKRDVCGKCNMDGGIYLPPTIAATKAYRVVRGEGSKGCEGCYWFDDLRPLYPEKLEGLQEQLNIRKSLLQRVADIVKKGR